MQPSPQFQSGRVVPLRPGAVPLAQAKRTRFVKIGRLLIAAELISQDSLLEALTISEELQQPIGKVLTSTQQISENELQSALLAQSMLSEGLLEEHLAIEALKLAAREFLPFSNALEALQTVSQKSPLAGELEEILVSSGMVSSAVLDDAKRLSLENGLPLGSSLISLRGIVFAHLNYAFECLNLVHEGRLSKAIAVKALADVKQNGIDLSQALKRQRISTRNTQSKLKLGDLLTASSVVSEKDTITAVEKALMEKRLIGEILVKSGMISADMLQDALIMQSLVVKDVISKDEAANVLKQVVLEKKGIVQVAKERGSFQDDNDVSAQALDLLIRAKLVAVEAVPQAMARQQRYGMDALKSLIASDLVTSNVCNAAIECAKLMEADNLTQQESVLTLHHCHQVGCDFQKALSELGLVCKKDQQDDQRTANSYKSNNLPSWSTSFEMKLAAIVVLVGIAGGIATMILNPSHLAGYSICAIVLAVGVAFFTIGRIWECRVSSKKTEMKKQQEISQQQISRLVKIRSRESY